MAPQTPHASRRASPWQTTTLHLNLRLRLHPADLSGTISQIPFSTKGWRDVPFDHEAFGRRRRLLGFSQMDLAIVAGVHEHTVGRLERGQAANDGGNLSIDVFARLCIALQMEYRELLIPPTGNVYEKAIRFAHQEHSSAANPKIHDRGRSIRAQGFRKMTGVRTALDQAIIDRPEEDAPTVEVETTIRASDYASGELPIVEAPHAEDLYGDGGDVGAKDWNFTDPSTS